MMRGLHLVHDVLDAQLLDHRQDKVGRVDALVLELRDGRPPRVAAILIGGPARAERIGRPMVWLSGFLRALARVRHAGVSRVAFEAVRVIGDTVTIDIDGKSLDSAHLEQWLADRIVCRIPGASGERK
jgi:hypothetical protein